MVSLKYIRAEISKEESERIIQAVTNGTKTPEQAASELGMDTDTFKKQYDNALKSYGSLNYGNDVQKIISYKGTVRQMTLSASNRKGGKYPLRVVNIYIKPDTERYYEQSIYSVDKAKIRHGSPDQGYHPDKAQWSKTIYGKKAKTEDQTQNTTQEPSGKNEWKAAPGFEVPRRKKVYGVKPKLRKQVKRAKSRRSK